MLPEIWCPVNLWTGLLCLRTTVLQKSKFRKKWVGKSLSEIDVRRTRDVNVVGVRIGDKIQVNIDPKEPLQKDMMLIMIGSNEALENFGEKQVKE